MMSRDDGAIHSNPNVKQELARYLAAIKAK